MAKGTAADSIMAAGKMKPLLALSKREPLHAAIGLTSEGEGVILFDKKAKPRQVSGMLKASAAKADIKLNPSTVRFGRAEVDVDYDPTMVRFYLNKEAPGSMRLKLVEVLKKASFAKVELNVDPSLDTEAEEGATAEAAPGTDALPEAADPAAADPAAADPAALNAELAALISRIPRLAKEAGQRGELAKIAGDANAKVKAGDGPGATAAIAALRTRLDEMAAQPGSEPAAAAPDPAALRTEMVALIGRITQVAGNDAARKATLLGLANGVNAALKDKNAANAADLIAKFRSELDQGAPQAEGGEDVAAQLRERLDVCTQDLQRIEEPAVRGVMQQSAAGIEGLLKQGDAEKAAKLLDVLETQISKAVRAARQEAVQREAGSLVEFGKLSIQWRSAQQTFDANLQALGAKLLATPEIKADPRFTEIEKAVAALPGLVPKFGGELQDALDAGINAKDPSEKKKLAARSAAAIDGYLRMLDGAPFLAALEQFASQDLGADLPLHGALAQALTDLSQRIRA